MKKIFFLIVILVSLFYISSDEIEVEGKIVYKIIFKGLKKVKERELKSVQQFKEGMQFDPMLIDQDYKSFFDLDYFDDIIVKADKATDEKGGEIPGMINIIYEFKEKPTIRKIIFKGNNNIPYGYLIGDITIKRGDFVKKSTIVSDIYTIKDKYQKKGFNYVEVDYELFTNDELKSKNQVDLIFNIKEGIETYISEIIIEGNEKFSDFSLKNRMKTKEKKFLGLQKGTFIASDFYQDIEDLKKYYREQGFYFVEIFEPEVNRYEVVEEENKKREVIKIRIQIKEGSQYKYGRLKIEGNKIFTYDDLTYAMKLRPGNILNYSKFQEDMFSLQKKYNDSGYVQTQVSYEPEVDEENKIITFKVKIVESKLSYIEAVYFKGNVKTKNYVLYRAIYTEVGQIFDSSKLIASIYGLYNLGFFSKVDYDIQVGSAEGLLKITYILEEQSTAEIRFGMQITTNKWPLDITLFGEITEKNFLGRELTIGGKIDLSLYKQGFEFRLEDPWFLNYPWSLGTSLKFYHNWTQKVYRKLTIEDYQTYAKSSGASPNPTENDVRVFYDNTYANKDEENPNYVGYGPGNWWTMGISDLTFELGLSTGYRFLKYFSVGGSYTLSPIYTFMLDNSLIDQVYSYSYRQLLKENNGWSVKSRLATTFSINTTKQRINPYDGLKFSITAAYTWGHFDSVALSTKFTYYWNILDINFNDYPFKHVLVFNAAASFIFPGFRNLGGELNGESTAGKGPILYATDYLTVDGFFIGRGWANSIGATNYEGRLTNKRGYARFDFSVEYRIPINEKFIWLAAFIDVVNLVEGPIKVLPLIDKNGNVISKNGSYDDSKAWMWWNQLESNKWYEESMTNWYGIENWYGSMGVGFQITFPQLPLSFYVVKRFKVNPYSGFEWVTNQPETGNLDFVLSIVGYYF
ncbi:MAG TPA: outer membrane protein assembly factor BamA [Spirochaetota bacterium]|nr:outer membrane protein assembly factor BamA [Spirochaetota bacterium]